MTRHSSDVAILGGGVIGLICALYLLKDGRSVTVIDRGPVGRGSSHGNCGTITPSHAMPLAMPGMVRQGLAYMLTPDAPFYLKPRFDPALAKWLLKFVRRCNWRHFRQVMLPKAKLLLDSRNEIERLVRDEQLDCEFEALGTLYVYRTEEAFAKSRWIPEALAEAGLPTETLTGAQCREKEPAVNDAIIGGYFNPLDAHLRPDRYVAELARRVRELGGTIVEHAEITAIADSDGPHVVANGERHDAKDLVVALGAWTPKLAKQLGLTIPIQPGKGYSITYDVPGMPPRIPVTLKERQVCVTAWPSGFRLGSTMEFSGYDETLNPVRLGALERAAGEYLRTPPIGPRREEWYGWRPMTYDDMPIIGRTQSHPNVIMATGHGMLGVTLSAVTAMLVTDIVANRTPSIDPAPYALDRFR